MYRLILNVFGGKPGIRTLGTLLTSNGFQDRRNRPLCQLPVKVLQQRCVSRHVIQYIANPTCRQVDFFLCHQKPEDRRWCAEGDSNPHARKAHAPEACVSTNSTIGAFLNGRSNRIRTCDLSPPRRTRYRAALYSEFLIGPRPVGAPKMEMVHGKLNPPCTFMHRGQSFQCTA